MGALKGGKEGHSPFWKVITVPKAVGIKYIDNTFIINPLPTSRDNFHKLMFFFF